MPMLSSALSPIARPRLWAGITHKTKTKATKHRIADKAKEPKADASKHGKTEQSKPIITDQT
jgi:hypothetical protein